MGRLKVDPAAVVAAGLVPGSARSVFGLELHGVVPKLPAAFVGTSFLGCKMATQGQHSRCPGMLKRYYVSDTPVGSYCLPHDWVPCMEYAALTGVLVVVMGGLNHIVMTFALMTGGK